MLQTGLTDAPEGATATDRYGPVIVAPDRRVHRIAAESVGLKVEAFSGPVRRLRAAQLLQCRLRTEPAAEIPSVAEGPLP